VIFFISKSCSIDPLSDRMRYGSLPVDSLHSWASLNGADFPVAKVVTDILDHEGNSKGGGLIAKREAVAGELLLKVPAELVVSGFQVELCSKTDTTLKELMERTAEFAKVCLGRCSIITTR
jgi:hypothetical protein